MIDSIDLVEQVWLVLVWSTTSNAVIWLVEFFWHGWHLQMLQSDWLIIVSVWLTTWCEHLYKKERVNSKEFTFATSKDGTNIVKEEDQTFLSIMRQRLWSTSASSSPSKQELLWNKLYTMRTQVSNSHSIIKTPEKCSAQPVWYLWTEILSVGRLPSASERSTWNRS